MSEECRFSHSHGYCETHRASHALCTHAAQALQAALTVAETECADRGERLGEIALLVGADDYSDIVERVKALQQHKLALETNLAKAASTEVYCGAVCGTCGFTYREHKGHIRRCPVCQVGELQPRVDELQKAYDKLTGEKFSDRVHAALHDRLASLDAQNAALLSVFDAICQKFFDGDVELDSFDFYEMGERAGLLEQKPYDPEKHGYVEAAEPGEMIYVKVKRAHNLVAPRAGEEVKK